MAVRRGDRHAASSYFQMVLARSPSPEGLPSGRLAAYVPESAMVVVEHELPAVEVVPAARAFRYVRTRDAIEPVARPTAEVGRRYRQALAQIALRTVREIFTSDPSDLVQAVVFNGIVRHVDRSTGRPDKTCLISCRATRERFTQLVLEHLEPVDCLRRYFFADVSSHPEELVPVEPVLRFDLADPRVVDPVDVASSLDRRPNLLDLTATQFEAFVQNLFARMPDIEAKLFRASNDGGVDCVAYHTRSIFGGRFIVQAKLYTGTVPPTAVRDLYGTVQHEGATKGILITTSGYGPSSYEFANGKPLDLIDGTGLLALCQSYEIPARILRK